MFLKKVLISAISVSIFLSTSVFAKHDENKGYKKEFNEHKKYKKHKAKQKKLPYGLQKKINNGGTLPPGWQKKLKRGEVINQSILDSGIILDNRNYPDIRNTKVYKVQDRIFRVAQDTKEILDILK